jgi:hypothetical protein
MNSLNATALKGEKTNTRSERSTQLSGHWLVLADAVCVALFCFSLTVFVADLPSYFAQLHIVCGSSKCALWQLTPASVLELQQVGLTVESYAVFSVAFSIFSVFVWSAVGAIIALRKPNDRIALLVSMLLVTSGVAGQNTADFNQLTTLLVSNSSPWFAPTLIVSFLAAVLFLLVFLLFPDGRFVPGWMRWQVVVGMALTGGGAVLYLSHAPFSRWLYPLILMTFVGTYAPSVFVQLYRYRYVSNPIQRQQTRWIVLGAIVGLLVLVGEYLPPLIFSSLNGSGSLYFVILKPISTLILLYAPLCFGIAILRYHLWDIDVIINRTLVYGVLTGTLALVYIGSIIALQYLLRGLTQGYGLAIVGSTLAIAGLFHPLRRRIQTSIDRRFYRRKYDASRILAAFSATLRNEVDLTQLSKQLVAVIEETMQPAQVSLWLRPPERDRTPRTAWRANPSDSP